jgi:leucyl-tRNA synthetase
MKPYDHKKIEKKWQKVWDENKVYQTLSAKKAKVKKLKPYYVLDMFPYPSGAGLHVGHPRGYIASDVFARMKRMQGYNVLHPMGYDAFGLPAEQFAVQNKIHPRQAVEKNVKTFRGQLEKIGFSYDWDRAVNTTDPEYYKWTQWIFLQIYNSYYDIKKDKACSISDLVTQFEKSGNTKVSAVCDADTKTFTAKEWKSYSEIEQQKILMKYRLAYEGYAEVNWCPEMGTVLANDEIVDGPNGPVSERGGFPVEKKQMRQWFMRITAYADRLIAGLETIDWPESIKEIQKNWIGKSEGSEIDFAIKNNDQKITVFTTRADTLFGVTYVVLAPEHPLVNELKSQITNWDEVATYLEQVKNKSEIERTDAKKEKTGVYLEGVFAINPANGEQVPVWVADYVLANYGAGAVMGVPMHDDRDREFAIKYNLPIIDKPLVNSQEIVQKVGGKLVTKYKFRDAIFARQRYWGEPIPLVHEQDGTISEVPLKNLPLELPNVKSYAPAGNGESPLATVKSWVNAGYETNTIPGWAGSSWYFLRYTDPKNKKVIANGDELDYWFGAPPRPRKASATPPYKGGDSQTGGGVDMYVGGAEHATGHLLYSRFWHKFLFDLGYVPTSEPFKALRNQGMIGGTDGRKMSKRYGNVVNPDDVVAQFGADSMRVFEMFLGPFESHLPWSTEGIIGSRRFIEKVWRLAEKVARAREAGSPLLQGEGLGVRSYLKTLHKTIKKVTEDIQNFAFNTAISSMMICANELEKSEVIHPDDFKKFLQILAPFAPHVCEELWISPLLQGEGPGVRLVRNRARVRSIHLSPWPTYDPKLIIDDSIKMGIQVNGKVRAEIELALDVTEADVKSMVLQIPEIIKWIDGKEIKKFIYIPKKIISIVI